MKTVYKTIIALSFSIIFIICLCFVIKNTVVYIPYSNQENETITQKGKLYYYYLPAPIKRSFNNASFELLRCDVINENTIEINALIVIPTSEKTDISFYYPIISDIIGNMATPVKKEYMFLEENKKEKKYEINMELELRSNLRSNNLMFYIAGNQFLVMLNQVKGTIFRNAKGIF